MMYISTEEFEKSMPASTRAILSSDEDGIQDDTIIETVIKQASSMVDSYASYRYIIPLTYVSEQIKAVVTDIAVYRLFKRKDALSKEIQENYKQAVEYLRDIAQDRARIEEAELKASLYYNPDQRLIYAKYSSDEPKFDDESLEGWNIN